jgi:hypothetical protein
MFETKNLLDTPATSRSKYVTALMEILFTKEERQTGIIADENSKSLKHKLDPERVSLLKGK